MGLIKQVINSRCRKNIQRLTKVCNNNHANCYVPYVISSSVTNYICRNIMFLLSSKSVGNRNASNTLIVKLSLSLHVPNLHGYYTNYTEFVEVLIQDNYIHLLNLKYNYLYLYKPLLPGCLLA